MAELLKNQFFQPAFHQALAKAINRVHPNFSEDEFMSKVYNDRWDGMELKERMKHTALTLRQLLPEDYLKALDVLKKVCHHFQGFDGMVFPDFVEQFGLDYPEVSLDALELFTQYSSSEFAIRPFIVRYEDLAMGRMFRWSTDENYHIRRLSSEGCRPRLPWAMALPKFKKDPSLILPILENMKADPEEYVRKSVANNLNDITKDNKEIVLETLEHWNADKAKSTQWIIKHALRGLLKAGDKRALAILGFKKANVEIEHLMLDRDSISMGEELNFSFKLTNQGKSKKKLMVDYVIHFVKSNGSTAPKVFKLTNIDLSAEDTVELAKKHEIKPITTRKYYAGVHRLEIQVNGQMYGGVNFELVLS
ncbi:MAG: DNA alkylation repair protein [Bacteroidota bacterium]